MSAQTLEEQRLIDGLFSRLQDAESKSGERDKDAETRIQEHVARQPAAPYYMTQTILIQEAALNRLQARVEELERQVEQQRHTEQRPSSGGFLAGIFGAGEKPVHAPQSAAQQERRSGGNAPAGGHSRQSGWGAPSAAAPGYGNAPGGMMSRGGGFLGGALQTAAGVAGGVMLGNMLMNMFDHQQPEELANAIEGHPETPQPEDTAATPDDAGSYEDASDTYGADEPRFEDADYYDDYGGGPGGDDFGDDSGFDEV